MVSVYLRTVFPDMFAPISNNVRRPRRISPRNGRVFTGGSCDPSLLSTVSKACQQTTFPICCLRCRSLRKVRDVTACNLVQAVTLNVLSEGFHSFTQTPPR